MLEGLPAQRRIAVWCLAEKPDPEDFAVPRNDLTFADTIGARRRRRSLPAPLTMAFVVDAGNVFQGVLPIDRPLPRLFNATTSSPSRS